MDTQDALAAKDAENERLKKENDELNEKLKKLQLERKEEIEKSFLENLFECPVCSYSYCKKFYTPVIGICGHTICDKCAEQVKKAQESAKCPICRADGSFTKPSKNFLACEFLEEINLIELAIANVNKQQAEETILVLGGTKTDKSTGGMFLLSPHKWIETQVKMPYPTVGSGAVCLNGTIYLIGGCEKPKALYKLNKYLKWTRLANMNIGRPWITNSCVAWNGYIWVMGGSDADENCRKSVERYDPKEDKWTFMPPMKYPRLWASAAVWNDGIVISGGNYANMNAFECFKDGCWTELPNTRNFLHSHILVSFKNKLIAMGGLDCQHNISGNVWEIEPQEENSKWRPLLPMRIPTDSFAGVVFGEEIYAIGGWQGSYEKNTHRVEIFDGEDYLHGPNFPYPIRNISAMIIPPYLANRLRHYGPCYPYNKKSRAPMVGTCGHSLCGVCAHTLSNPSCPICRAEDSFHQPSKNFLACEFLEKSNLLKRIDPDPIEPQSQQNTILLLGGTKNEKDYSGAIILSSDRSKWIELKLELPYKVYGSGAVYLNEEIYLIGGWNNPNYVYKLDKNLKWIRLANMHFIGRKWITNCCLAWNGYIWAFGGPNSNGKQIKNMERYDPNQDKWDVMTEMKHARSSAAATIWKERIVVTGGDDIEFRIKNTAECFYPENDTWLEIPALPTYRKAHCLISFKKKLIAMGGVHSTSDSKGMPHAWEIDLHNGSPKWKPLPPMKYPTYAFSGIVLDEEIYAIGGQKNDGSLNRVEIFDGENWRIGPSLPYPLSYMSAVIIPQTLADRLCA